MNMDLLGLVFGAGIIIVLLSVIVGLGVYLLTSFSLYTMAKNRNFEHAWFAFIPILQTYLLGKLIVSIKLGNFVIPIRAEYFLVGTSILTAIIGSTDSGIGTLISILAVAVFAITYYNLFIIYKRDVALVFTIVGIILPITLPIFLFIVRNNEADLSEVVEVK